MNPTPSTRPVLVANRTFPPLTCASDVSCDYPVRPRLRWFSALLWTVVVSGVGVLAWGITRGL